MKLGEYRVAFPWYPWLPEISPFAGWTPGQTLGWYAAYNKVKHDRESQFREATLERALTAVAGSFVMLCAQYGWDFARSGDAGSREFFLLAGAPNWAPADLYLPPYSDAGYRPRKYFQTGEI